ncbi:hypothetical protein PM082_020708 [Marasmius tenuissimus]|nr:hypothetical protein PM082_020708 [Marasmius tenuissimus]
MYVFDLDSQRMEIDHGALYYHIHKLEYFRLTHPHPPYNSRAASSFGADGFRSITRETVAPGHPLKMAGDAAFRIIVPVELLRRDEARAELVTIPHVRALGARRTHLSDLSNSWRFDNAGPIPTNGVESSRQRSDAVFWIHRQSTATPGPPPRATSHYQKGPLWRVPSPNKDPAGIYKKYCVVTRWHYTLTTRVGAPFNGLCIEDHCFISIGRRR